jgi:hypothetical protein
LFAVSQAVLIRARHQPIEKAEAENEQHGWKANHDDGS